VNGIAGTNEMASTGITYKGRYVQVPESIITILGYMLFHEGAIHATNEADKKRFERMARDFDSRLIGVGCAHFGLELLLNRDPNKENEFLLLIQFARARLASYGGHTLPKRYLDEFMPFNDHQRDGDLTTPWFRRLLDVIEALIRGQPTAPDYPLASVMVDPTEYAERLESDKRNYRITQ
jgi:hypothetical protein